MVDHLERHPLHHAFVLPRPLHLDIVARNLYPVAEEDLLQTPRNLGSGDQVQTQGSCHSSNPELHSLNKFPFVGHRVTDLERDHFNVSRAPPLH